MITVVISTTPPMVPPIIAPMCDLDEMGETEEKPGLELELGILEMVAEEWEWKEVVAEEVWKIKEKDMMVEVVNVWEGVGKGVGKVSVAKEVDGVSGEGLVKGVFSLSDAKLLLEGGLVFSTSSNVLVLATSISSGELVVLGEVTNRLLV